MEDNGGLMVIDGDQLRSLPLTFISDPDLPGLTGKQILDIVESAANSALFGLSSIPDSIRSAALKGIINIYTESFHSTEFKHEAAVKIGKEYLSALADQLRDEPLVVSVLDGSALRLFLDDEDDYAMLAENLFTDLDVQDTGKLSKNEIQNALALMGADMGVPPFSVSNDLLSSIMKKHGAEGEELLGQAQFAQLLQPVLQELADSLAKSHITVIQNIQILNGSKLRKELLSNITMLPHQLATRLLLGNSTINLSKSCFYVQLLKNPVAFSHSTGKMFEEWGAYQDGEGNKEKLLGFLQAKGKHLGLPPHDSNEAIPFMYDQIFLGITEKKIGGGSGVKFDLETFQDIIKHVLEKFAEQLEATPVFVGMETGGKF